MQSCQSETSVRIVQWRQISFFPFFALHNDEARACVFPNVVLLTVGGLYIVAVIVSNGRYTAVFVKKIMFSSSLRSYDDILVYNWFATSSTNNIYSGSLEAALSFQHKQALRSQTQEGPGWGEGLLDHSWSTCQDLFLSPINLRPWIEWWHFTSRRLLEGEAHS